MKSTTELTTLSVLFTSPALRHHPGKDFHKKPQTSQGGAGTASTRSCVRATNPAQRVGDTQPPRATGDGRCQPAWNGERRVAAMDTGPLPPPMHPQLSHSGRRAPWQGHSGSGPGDKSCFATPHTAWPNTHLPVHRNSLSWAPPIKGSIHKRREKGQPETGKEKENPKFKTEKANSLWKKHLGAQSSQEVRLPCLRNNKPPSFTSSK